MEKQKILYKTKTKRFIYEYLEANLDQRFTVKQIYEHLSKIEEGLNRTTVYRNLEQLCDQGDLIRWKDPDQDSWCYQYCKDKVGCEQHIHGQCSECGRIFHLDNQIVKEFEQKVMDTYGLNIDIHKTILIGKCNDCRN